MISPRAVEIYLTRKFRDSRRVKKFTERAIDRKISRLDPQPDFATPPRSNQKRSFLLGVKYGKYAFFADMGLGKSKLVIDLLSYAVKRGRTQRGLIVVPNVSNVISWNEQFDEHGPSFNVIVFDEAISGTAREEALYDDDVDVIVITYLGLLNLLCDKSAVPVGKQKRKLILSDKKVRRVKKSFKFFCFDESDVLKNHSSLFCRMATHLAKGDCEVYLLSGTPHGKNPEDLWSQFYLLDRGETLGETLGLFRAIFCKQVRGWGGFPEFKFDEKKKKLLHRVIRNRSLRYRLRECLDLPPDIHIVRRVVISEIAWKYYQKVVDDLKRDDSTFKVMDNTFLRMRQLSSGYLRVKAPDGTKTDITFDENPKLDCLIDLINEVPADSKIIVFHDYVTTSSVICNGLKKAKIKHVAIYGKTKKKRELFTKFKSDPTCRVLVMNVAVGGKGLNLQHANYIFFYESPPSPIDRSQAIARCLRGGQTKTVYVYDIVVRKTIDEKILKAQEKGIDLREAVLDGKEQLV